MQNDFYKLVMPDSVESYLKDIEKNAKTEVQRKENNLEFTQKAELAKLRSKHAEELALLKQQYARLQNTTTTQIQELTARKEKLEKQSHTQQERINLLEAENSQGQVKLSAYLQELQTEKDKNAQLTLAHQKTTTQYKKLSGQFKKIDALAAEYIKERARRNAFPFVYFGRIDSTSVDVFPEKLITILKEKE